MDTDNVIVQAVANVLSTLTVLSCVFLKVPQIQSMRQKRSAEGIYIQALMMEITGFTIVILYNFLNSYGVMTYLECPIILLQIYVMLYYVLKFNNMLDCKPVHLSIAAYFTISLCFLGDLLPKSFLGYLVPLCTPLSGFAKVTYIYGIVSAGNAEAVSLTTWIISVSANLARLFTVYVDSADPKLLFNFSVSSVLSMGVLLTAMYYQKFPTRPPKGHDRRKTSRRSHSD